MRARRVLLAMTLVTVAACGHRMDTATLREANGARDARDRVATATTAATAGDAPLVTDAPVDAAAPGGTVGATAPTSPTPAGARSSPTGAAARATTPGKAGCATRDSGRLAIGSVGNYSGPAGASLMPSVRGLQVWAAWVNGHGGVCGRQVQIVVVDDHSDPAQYRSALEDLVKNRHVVSFTNFAAVTGAAGVSYIESVRVPVIGTTGAVPAETDSPMYFLASARNTVLVFATAKTAAMFGPPSHRYGFVTCREVSACGSEVSNALNDDEGRRAGVSIVYRGQASIAQPDYTSECQAARAAGAEVLSVFLDSASLRRWGRSCARQGYTPVYSGIAGTIDADLPKEPGYATVLMVSPTFPFTATATAAQREFHQAMDALYDDPPGPGESLGWAYGKMFERAAAIAAAKTGTITSASLIDALHTLRDESFDGLTIPVTYPAGKPGVYPPCWFVLKATNGAWTTLNESRPVCR